MLAMPYCCEYAVSNPYEGSNLYIKAYSPYSFVWKEKTTLSSILSSILIYYPTFIRKVENL
uniref:Uncharacterized protein n=1 Tax=Rhizophora mucronata TaxID=61149 RepID=A0A2P2NVR3_RHIMU